MTATLLSMLKKVMQCTFSLCHDVCCVTMYFNRLACKLFPFIFTSMS